MEENTNEMLKHLDNILVKIDLLSKNVISELKYNLEDLERVKNIITQFKDILKNKKNIFLIDLEKLKEISNIIFELNCDNLFSDSTDYISNELYAFEFLLQEKWKEVRSMSKEQAINKLFFDFIKTLNLVFADDFYKNTFELKKIPLGILEKYLFFIFLTFLIFF